MRSRTLGRERGAARQALCSEPVTFNEGPKEARFWHKCTRPSMDPQTHYSIGPCPRQVKKTSFHARYLPSLYTLKSVPSDTYLISLKLWCIFPTHNEESKHNEHLCIEQGLAKSEHFALFDLDPSQLKPHRCCEARSPWAFTAALAGLWVQQNNPAQLQG